MEAFKPILARIAEGAPLEAEEATAAFELIMSGAASPAQIGAFLMALRLRGESVAEIAAAARVLRAKCLRVAAPPGAIDTCGTGGDGAGTLNISTGAAFVVAACGVPVAKHGNRALSSKSGSADVLAALGLRIDLSPELTARCIAEAGLGFMMAPLHHAAMRHVAEARRELGLRTLFNLIGPLANPAGAERQLLGVFADHWVEPLALVLHQLGSRRAWVVHGTDGLDEITTTGPTLVAELAQGQVHRFTLTPEAVGLRRARPEDLKGGDAADNAAALRDLLADRPGPYRDVVLLNAAAALVIAERARDLGHGLRLGAEALAAGRGRQVLDRLIALSQQQPPQPGEAA